MIKSAFGFFSTLSFFAVGLLFGPAGAIAGWGSGGGSGVACFTTTDNAKLADTYFKKKVQIPFELKKQISKLVTLEYWENYSELSPLTQASSRDAILSELRTRLKKHSPIFYFRYELVQNRISIKTWKNNQNLQVIEDRNPVVPIEEQDPHCRLIQLVVRWTESVPGKLPKARVEVDKALFEKLDAFNQALLQLHEELYLIGREAPTAHVTSDKIRGEVALLLSREFWDSVLAQPSPAKQARVLQVLVHRIFGDYFNYFLNDDADKLPKPPAGYNQYSRFKSFRSFLERVRIRKARCLDRFDLSNVSEEEAARLSNLCSGEALTPGILAPLITDEEAFLYVSRWVQDYYDVIDNSENLVVWDRRDPSAVSPLQKSELSRACQDVYLDRYNGFHEIILKAARYCRVLGY